MTGIEIPVVDDPIVLGAMISFTAPHQANRTQYICIETGDDGDEALKSLSEEISLEWDADREAWKIPLENTAYTIHSLTDAGYKACLTKPVVYVLKETTVLHSTLEH